MGASTGGLTGWKKVSAMGLVSVLAIAVGVNVLADDDNRGEVVRVVDGDTLIAEVAGQELTIRLLNIDTPETKHPDHPVQCLGPEATAFLTERLPAGTEIELEYDEEREDRYGRTLAGVVESDSLVNAEIAAAGLGVPVLFEPNDRFLREVTEASEDARENARGLFSPTIDCTIPAQVASLTSALDGIPTGVDGDPATPLVAAEELVADVDALALGLEAEGLPGLGHAVMLGSGMDRFLSETRREVRDLGRGAESTRDTLRDGKKAYDEEQERLREEREQREREEREQREREEREEREREERERQGQERPKAKAPAPKSSGSTSQSSGKKSSSARTGAKSGSSGSSSGSSGKKSGESGNSSGGGSDSGKGGKKSGGSGSGSGGKKSGSGCTPYGPEIPYSDDGGYTGKRYGMPGGKTFRKCS